MWGMSKMTIQQAIQINAWLDRETRRHADHVCIRCAVQGLKRRLLALFHIDRSVSSLIHECETTPSESPDA